MLPKKDVLEIHAALERCRGIADLKALQSFIATEIRSVLPHEGALFGLADIASGRILRLVKPGVSATGSSAVTAEGSGFLSPPLRRLLGARSLPAMLRLEEAERSPTLGKDRGLSLACHGIVTLGGAASSFFAFLGRDMGDPGLCRDRLACIVPHLHAALMSLLAGTPPLRSSLAGELTPRERQVLRWIAAGKSNWEIGKILLISEFTVKNHVQNLLKKLSVSSRAQAASLAIAGGFVAEAEIAPPRTAFSSSSRPTEGSAVPVS